MDKQNNYHFGRHVFEYFPWYKYKEDTNIAPELNKEIHEVFLRAFNSNNDNSCAILAWRKLGDLLFSTVSKKQDISLSIGDKKVTYFGISESIDDWEDIEKIRLRLILGTKSKAENYMKVIDAYNNYHNTISDAIYSYLEKDINIPIVGIYDYISRDNKEVCKKLIAPEDVYKYISKTNFSGHDFLISIHKYYKRNKMLTEKQINVVKELLYKKICSDMSNNIVIFDVKSNKINFSRITEYFTQIG